MAGGVMTCQVTHTPICGKDAMAIIVRQSVYEWDKWVPVTIPSYGLGNDDFMALHSLKPSRVQDDFANVHLLVDMEAFLDEAFIGNNHLPKKLKEEKLRGLPVGLVYINNELWQDIRAQVPMQLQYYRDLQTDVNKWVADFIEFIQKKVKEREFLASLRDDKPSDALDRILNDHDMESWYFYHGWNEDVSRYMENWSQHCKLFSLEAYFPIAKQRALDNDVEWLTEFFNGLLELIYIYTALCDMRQNWFPQVTFQEYDICKLHDFVAQTVRKDFIAEEKERKERGY